MAVDSVRTWYAERGAGEPLVYLHGGWSDSRELDPVLADYASRFHLYTPDRRGHGRTPDVPGPITYDLLTADLVAFLETVVGGPAHLVGYSDGATVALHVALSRPDLVRRLVCISGQFHRDGLPPELLDEFGDLSGTPLAERYGKVSPDGVEHFPVIVEKVAQLARTEPGLTAADLTRVAARTLVMAADDDVVTLEHTLALYRGLPDAELAIVPGTSHVLIMEKPRLVAQLVLDFLTLDAAPTIVPIRRAPR